MTFARLARIALVSAGLVASAAAVQPAPALADDPPPFTLSIDDRCDRPTSCGKAVSNVEHGLIWVDRAAERGEDPNPANFIPHLGMRERSTESDFVRYGGKNDSNKLRACVSAGAGAEPYCTPWGTYPEGG